MQLFADPALQVFDVGSLAAPVNISNGVLAAGAGNLETKASQDQHTQILCGCVLRAGEAEFRLPGIVHLDDLPVALGDTRWIKGSACDDLSSDREGCDSNAVWA